MRKSIAAALAALGATLALAAPAQATCQTSSGSPGEAAHCYGSSSTYLHEANAEQLVAFSNWYISRGGNPLVIVYSNAVADGCQRMGVPPSQGCVFGGTTASSRSSNTSVHACVNVLDLVAPRQYTRYCAWVLGSDQTRHFGDTSEYGFETYGGVAGW